MTDVLGAWDIHAGSEFDLAMLTAGESLPRVWREVFAEQHDKVALDGDTGRVTYSELDELSLRVASGLDALGVGVGDHVAVFAPTSLEFIAIYLGVLRRGAVFLPINTAYREREVTAILRKAGPQVVAVSDSESAAIIKNSRGGAKLLDLSNTLADADTDFATLSASTPGGSMDLASGSDPAMLVFTSGTTGSSKAVILSHMNLLAGTRSVVMAWGWTSQDRLLLTLPLFHLHGLGVGLNGTLTTGSSAVIHSQFDSARVLSTLQEQGITMFFGVPAMYQRIVENAAEPDLSNLRLIVSGSAPLPESLFRQVSARFGMDPLERYGMSETLMNVSNPLHGERRPGSVGIPLPGVEVRLVADGFDVAPCIDGEIWLKGPNVFAGYYDDEEANRQAFIDGWFRSGDLGRSDTDGYLRITGRLKELIITGGYNVFPREVEEVLAEHPAVDEAAVVGIPSERWGEEVSAFVVPISEAPDREELRKWCSERLANFKVPKQIKFVDHVPRNALGKIQRHLLNE